MSFKRTHARSFGRQREDEMLNCSANTQDGRFGRHNRLLYSSSHRGVVLHPAASEKIDATIVRDPKQPRLQRPAVVELIEFSISFE
jgi:hypothetical protein